MSSSNPESDSMMVPLDNAELPFLVTHWLAHHPSSSYNYATPTSNTQDDDGDEERRRDAMRRIRRAAADLALAFQDLGAFGVASRPSLDYSTNNSLFGFRRPVALQHASYSDVSRRWAGISGNHLQNVVQSVASTRAIMDSTLSSSRRPNLILAATEERQERQKHSETGRSLQEAIALDTDAEQQPRDQTMPPTSILQRPPFLLPATRNDETSNNNHNTNSSTNVNNEGGATTRSRLNTAKLILDADYGHVGKEASDAMRLFLSLREQKMNVVGDICSLQLSLSRQELDQQRLSAELATITAAGVTLASASSDSDPRTRVDDILEGQQNCERVMAQLKRRLEELQATHDTLANSLSEAERNAKQHFRKAVTLVSHYNDSLLATKHPLVPPLAAMGRPSVFFDVLARQCGGGGSLRRRGPATYFGAVASLGSTNAIRQSILLNRLSHTATINSHMAYPVYCLRFDRTGRYFITGADDYLVKVFCLGVSKSCDVRRGEDGNRMLRVNYGANATGAVLVTTLRGHAGVINDIDVSADNCFLATASEDGDCRIWGLRDGCPIAILRGHTGGANMVSWSTLTPYQLVTTGADGLARTWDIREAALKRYGSLVGKRPEYRRSKGTSASEANNHAASLPADSSNVPAVPPLPPSPNEPLIQQPVPVDGGVDVAILVAPLPPLPPGNVIIAAQNETANDAGQFIANDAIDEGVQLLSKLEHGPDQLELNATGTRNRRSTVKVICVTRSPLGHQFATGSDDGVCRIWEDEGDDYVKKIDSLSSTAPADADRSRRAASSTKILATLPGHVGAITDMHYSHSGDRLLTASQKDGVVRIWSAPSNALLSQRQAGNSANPDSRVARATDLLQIIINLTDPNSSVRSSGANSRRRSAATSSASEKVSCDVAVWLQDDSAIVTSQSIQVKQTTTEIVPGSQFLFLWDSSNGQCMLGISSAHTMQCPVVIPHPTNSNLICSAGGDGFVKVWDLTSGECKFQHKNTVDFGPIDPNDVGKISGFLDGAFSPCGTKLVLTDDSGRVTICESQSPAGGPTTEAGQQWALKPIPATIMREQYFASDYYDLRYDANGYCVEAGSGQPPHLAPRGARISHNGNSWPEDLNDAFLSLVGPSPLPVKECKWLRNEVRARSNRGKGAMPSLRSNTLCKKGIALGEFNPQTTRVIRIDGTIVDSRSRALFSSERASFEGNGRAHRLSSNYRWRDYSDILREEGNEADEPDSDDEEFELQPRRRNATNLTEFSDESDMDLDDQDVEPIEAESTRSQRAYRRQLRSVADSRSNAPSRMSTRRAAAIDSDSSNDEFEEFISTNNTPFGPHVQDYRVHFFRLSEGAQVARQRLRRLESLSSYNGHKNYTPQVGDTVVYIPRAHYEALKKFPNLPAPWQKWPNQPALPFVRCKILDIRFRFPYKEYFREFPSVVAILTLDVTGVPDSLDDKTFWWPRPFFKDSGTGLRFEVSIFDIDSTEFLMPIGLYEWRLSSIENALMARNLDYDGLEVEAFYANEEQEDSDLIPYLGKVVGRSQIQDPESNPHLVNSGFGSILVRWTDGTDVDVVSPWEVNLRHPGQPMATASPILDAWERKRVSDAIERVVRKRDVKKYFLNPVNERRYSDYQIRIEIPMDISFIYRRLEASYYATRSSVVSDFKLIHTNCVKYNGVGEISNLAKEAYEEFERLVLTEDERRSLPWNQIQPKAAQMLPSEQHDEVDSTHAHANGNVGDISLVEDASTSHNGGPVLRSRRNHRGLRQGGTRSTLENSTRAVSGFASPEGGHRRLRIGSRIAPANQRLTRSMGAVAAPFSVNRDTRSRSQVEIQQPIDTAADDGSDNDQQQRRRSVSQSRSRAASTRTRRNATRPESQTTALPFQDSDSNADDNSLFSSEADLKKNRSSSRTNARTKTHESDDDFSDDDDILADSDSETYSEPIRKRRSVGADSKAQSPSTRSRRTTRTSTSFQEDESDFETQNQVTRTRRGLRIQNKVKQEDSASEDPTPPTRTRRGLRTKSTQNMGQPTEDSDSQARSPPIRTRRVSRTAARKNHAQTEASDSVTNSRPVRTRGGLRSADRQNDTKKEDSESEAHAQSSRPRGGIRHKSKRNQDQTDDSDSDIDSGPSRNRSGRNTMKRSQADTDDSDTEVNARPQRTKTPRNAAQESVGSSSAYRSSRRKAKPATYYEKSSSGEDLSSEEEQHVPQRTRNSNNRNEDFQFEDDKSAEEAKSRKRAASTVKPRRESLSELQTRRSSRAKPSSVQKGQVQAESYEDDEGRKSRKRSQPEKINELVSRRSTRGASRGALEGVDDVDNQAHQSRKRARPELSNGGKGSKRLKGKSSSKSPVSKWPEIKLRSITKVTRLVMTKLAKLDEENLFDAPVAEKFPDLEELYLSHIETPMDFRTISEERLHLYESISELQDDLMLVFGNCLKFNANDDVLAGFARFMIEQMDSIFRDACLEAGESDAASALM